jgi:ssDNA-binding Zn-finger/Zn-ribbon topoisomerase 1
MSNPPVKYQRDLYVRHAVSGALFRWWFAIEDRVVFGNRVIIVAIPCWALAAFAAAPTLLIWRHDRKRDPNACPKCGYSRTGLPADRACPECGCMPA